MPDDNKETLARTLAKALSEAGRPRRDELEHRLLLELINALSEEKSSEDVWTSEKANEKAKLLKERLASYHQPSKFDLGDLVKWKSGFKNKRRPAYGEPAIVIEVPSVATINTEASPGSAYYREPLDIVLGVIDEDGDWVRYYFDSRRFEPYTAS